MNYWATVLILFSSCAGTSSIGFKSNCGIMLAGDIQDRFGDSWLTVQDLQQATFSAIRQASLVTDFVFMDQTENCRSMQGYRVYTHAGQLFDLDGRTVYAYTNCQLKMMVIGTPKDGNWKNSSIVHEMYHVMQECHAKMPVDEHRFLDERDNQDHANWKRDGIWQAIDRANGE